jgi:hypothetical protein
MGGKFHLKLNIGERPIVNKYREGKMKRTLKRELKVLEIAKREALETSDTLGQSLSAPPGGACTGQPCMRFRKGGCGFMILRQSRSIRAVGEGGEKGRRVIPLLYSCCSTSAWIEEVMVRRLRLGPAFLLLYLLS